MLRVTHAEANYWLLRALRTALKHWSYRPGNPLSGLRHMDTSRCNMGAMPSVAWATLMKPAWVPSREAEGQIEAEQPPAPSPLAPPHRAPEGAGHADRPPPPNKTDPPAASQAAPGSRGWPTAPAEHAAGGDARRHAAGRGGRPGPGPSSQPPAAAEGPGQGTGGGRRDTTAQPQPAPSPYSPPPSSPRDAEGGPRGRRPFTPPRHARGGSPPPKRAAAPGGGAPLGPHARRPHTATRPLPR